MSDSEDYNEKILIRRIKKGEPRAFDEIYHHYCGRVYRFAYSFLKNRQDSEEIVQDTFLKVWNSRRTIDESFSFRAFLFTITYNIIIDKFRERAKERKFRQFLKMHAVQSENDTEKKVEFSELNEFYKKAIEQLPSRRKTIYLMHRFKGLTYKEIANQLQISPKTVENQMTQALKFIGERLAQKQV